MRGGCIGDARFRRGAIRRAMQLRARTAVIMAGGNGLARADFAVRRWIAQLDELSLGLLPAGVSHIEVLPIPPPAGRSMSARRFQRRRWTVNGILRRLLRRRRW